MVSIKPLTRQLQQGSQGDDVKRVQNMLKGVGYNLVADGIYGSATISAVRDFQQKNALPVTGIVDNTTYYKLFKPPSRPIPFQPPPTPTTQTATLIPVPDTINEKSDKIIIKNVQIFLADLGYKVLTTSVWDKQTQAAVLLFKKDHLSKGGIFGVNLLISPTLTKREYNQLKTIAYSYRDMRAKNKPIPIPTSYQEKEKKEIPQTLTTESLPEGMQLEETGTTTNNKMIFVILALIGGALAFGMAKKTEGEVAEKQEEKVTEKERG